MKQLRIEPAGWPCTLAECPPGLFVCGETVGIKTEYIEEGPYLVEGGSVFWGGTQSAEVRRDLIVQPCRVRWSEAR
jgi:hypothetical protein